MANPQALIYCLEKHELDFRNKSLFYVFLIFFFLHVFMYPNPKSQIVVSLRFIQLGEILIQ